MGWFDKRKKKDQAMRFSIGINFYIGKNKNLNYENYITNSRYNYPFIFLLSCNEELVEQAQSGILKGKVVKRGTNVPLGNVKILLHPLPKRYLRVQMVLLRLKTCPLEIIL